MNFREGQQVILQIETKRDGLRARFESVGIVNSRFAYVAGMRFRQSDGQRSSEGAPFSIVPLTEQNLLKFQHTKPLTL
jgi:hypothetical protein